VQGNVLTGHGKEQIEDVAFEESGASSMLFGEGNLDLPEGAAVLAMDTRDGKNDGGVFSTEWQRAKTSFFGAFLPNVGRLAVWTDEFFGTDGNEKFDAAGNDVLSEVGVASNAVHVIQYCCGQCKCLSEKRVWLLLT
jgi:hypothetical protein